MKPKKKNKIFTLIFSLIPGAAEMYMGFMKMGLSLMVVFALSIMLPAMISANDVFLFMVAVLWFFGFFHARNIAACDEETFGTVDDKFIWEEFTDGKPVKIPGATARKWIAGALIVIGCAVLWNNMSYFVLYLMPDYYWDTASMISHRVPEIVVSVLIILLGIFMIKGKKQELEEEEKHDATDNGTGENK